MIYKFSLASYNIDGLAGDPSSCYAYPTPVRTEMCIQKLLALKPDIICLQEVTSDTLPLVKRMLAREYNDIEERDSVFGYFTKSFLRKSSPFKMKKSDLTTRTRFNNSAMNRDLLWVNLYGNDGESMIRIGNTHLESTKEYGEKRVKQLENSLETLYLSKPQFVALNILVGDLNIRDNEVKQVELCKKEFSDAWVMLGKQEAERYTWDAKSNNVVFKMCNNTSTVRCRFDRCFYVANEKTTLTSFRLVGKEFKKSISDHYCLFIEWDISSEKGFDLVQGHVLGSGSSVIKNDHINDNNSSMLNGIRNPEVVVDYDEDEEFKEALRLSLESFQSKSIEKAKTSTSNNNSNKRKFDDIFDLTKDDDEGREREKKDYIKKKRGDEMEVKMVESKEKESVEEKRNNMLRAALSRFS